MNWRSKKLKNSARYERCVSCGVDDGTIVWAHSNNQRHGKGMGIKAHDLFGAYLCGRCHSEFDGKKKEDGWFIDQWEKSMIVACKMNYL